MGEVRKVFDAPFSGREASQKLFQLRQDSRSLVDYAVDICTLAAESAWNHKAPFDMFLHSVSEEVKDELAAWELPTALDFPHRFDHPYRWAITGMTEGEEIGFHSHAQGSHLASESSRKLPMISLPRETEASQSAPRAAEDVRVTAS